MGDPDRPVVTGRIYALVVLGLVLVATGYYLDSANPLSAELCDLVNPAAEGQSARAGCFFPVRYTVASVGAGVLGGLLVGVGLSRRGTAAPRPTAEGPARPRAARKLRRRVARVAEALRTGAEATANERWTSLIESLPEDDRGPGRVNRLILAVLEEGFPQVAGCLPDLPAGEGQLANVDLQNALQRQQQTLQTISNVAKALHDTAMAVIRKIA